MLIATLTIILAAGVVAEPVSEDKEKALALVRAAEARYQNLSFKMSTSQEGTTQEGGQDWRVELVNEVTVVLQPHFRFHGRELNKSWEPDAAEPGIDHAETAYDGRYYSHCRIEGPDPQAKPTHAMVLEQPAHLRRLFLRVDELPLLPVYGGRGLSKMLEEPLPQSGVRHIWEVVSLTDSELIVRMETNHDNWSSPAETRLTLDLTRGCNIVRQERTRGAWAEVCQAELEQQGESWVPVRFLTEASEPPTRYSRHIETRVDWKSVNGEQVPGSFRVAFPPGAVVLDESSVSHKMTKAKVQFQERLDAINISFWQLFE